MNKGSIIQQPDKATLKEWTVKGAGYYKNKDYEEAVSWYRKAADQGDEKAKKVLARLEEKPTP